MKWCIEIRDKITDQYVSGGYLDLEELSMWDDEGYGIVFLDKYGAKDYEHCKAISELDKELEYLGSDDWMNDTIEKYFKEEGII